MANQDEGINLLADEEDEGVNLLADEQEHQPWYSRYPRDLASGLLEGARGIGNIPNMIGLPGAPHFEKTDFNKMVGLTGEPTLSDKLVNMLGQFAPATLLPEANIGRAGKLIGSIPKAGKFLKGAIEQAIPQAAYGATQNDNPLVGAAEGGLGSFIGSGIGAALGKGINALRPSQRYKSPLTKEQLARAYRQAEGTNMDLGNVIENPKLQRYYENKLPKKTGLASQFQQQTGQQIVQKGEGLLKKLLGSNSPENVPAQITKELTSEYAKHQKIKNNLYNTVDDIAHNENLNLNLDSFAKKAKEYMSAIEDTTLLKHEPDAKKIISKLMNYKTPAEETRNIGLLIGKDGKPLIDETTTKYPTLKEANILKGKLSNYANIYSQSPSGADRNIARIFRGLANTLKQDINQSIESHGSDLLKSEYQAAEKNYAKNFSPFLDKDVYKFISGNADPETIIGKFITRSNVSDLGGKLSKLADKLSKPSHASDESNLLAYGYLSRALDNEGNFNPAKFASSVKNLGKEQLKALFPNKKIRNEILDYRHLIRKNPRALNVMHNPLTGQVNSDLNPHTLSTIAGGLAGLMGGGSPGAIIGAAAGPLVSSGFARATAKKLADPVYRRKFVNALIKNKETKGPRKSLSKSGSIVSQQSHPIEMTLTEARGKEQ